MIWSRLAKISRFGLTLAASPCRGNPEAAYWGNSEEFKQPQSEKPDCAAYGGNATAWHL
nr:MAG TPA: hypothetical protein [Caudoviricetes sp.]